MKGWIRIVLGFVVGGVFLYLTLRQVELSEVARVMSRAKWIYFPLALASLAIGYVLRIFRWWWMLRLAGVEVKPRECGPPLIIGFALNNVLPLRSGDIIRCVAFAERLRTSASKLVGTVVVEQFLNLASLLVFVLAGLSLLPADRIDPEWARVMRLLGWGAVAGVMALIVFARPLEKLTVALDRRASAGQGLVHRVLGIAGQVLGTLSIMRSPTRAMLLILFSLVIWIFEAGLFLAIGLALGINVPIVAHGFAMGTGNLASLIPGTPGNVGTFDFFAARALGAFDVPPTDAAAYALITHVAFWIPITLVGGLIMIISGYRAVPTARDNVEEVASVT